MCQTRYWIKSYLEDDWGVGEQRGKVALSAGRLDLCDSDFH